MPNSIKRSGADGVALQVTKWARAAEMVEENSNDEATRLADVRVYAFDHVLLVVDLERVDVRHIAELVESAAGDTESIYRAWDASLQISGGGYQVQLPPAKDAGFTEGDTAPVHPAPGVMVIAKNRSVRLAQDLVSIREEQVRSA